MSQKFCKYFSVSLSRHRDERHRTDCTICYLYRLYFHLAHSYSKSDVWAYFTATEISHENRRKRGLSELKPVFGPFIELKTFLKTGVKTTGKRYSVFPYWHALLTKRQVHNFVCGQIDPFMKNLSPSHLLQEHLCKNLILNFF
jgi:hypothetical protein